MLRPSVVPIFNRSPENRHANRRTKWMAAFAGCLLLTSCGGGGGSTPAPVPVPVISSISFSPTTLIAGGSTTLTWSSSNATACLASGAWTGSQATSGSTTITQALAGTYSYNLTCSGAGGSASGSAALGVTGSASNVAAVVLDSGPPGVNNIINVPFVSVTLCRPGTSICQTIDHLLVDTGSYGLRIITPGVLDPTLALPAVNSAAGNPVGECAAFVSGFLWGSVHTADVKIAGETASSLPIQQVSDTSTAFSSIPSACRNTGSNLGTVAALGANGILGIGLFNQDCGSACATQVISGTYYGCTASACTGTTMPLAKQVANPVAAFAINNNGVALIMPAVPLSGSTTLTGLLIFGIDTQTNNNIGSATVYAANSAGNFTTVYKGVSLTSSFLDSGSNGLFFTDVTIPSCSISSSFYCPTTPLALSATNTSPINAVSGTVNFTVVNLQSLDPSVKAASVGGHIGRSNHSTFDFGMPFFFGRTVYVALSGASTLHGAGPFWAY